VSAVAQQEHLNPYVLGTRNPVPALQLDISTAGPNHAGRAYPRFDLLAGSQEVVEQSGRLVWCQSRRGLRPGKLDD
jgi:hypothetical protein